MKFTSAGIAHQNTLSKLGKQGALIQARIEHLTLHAELVDRAVIKDYKENDLMHLFPRYLGTVAERLNCIEQLLADNNPSEAHKLLHALVGPTGMLGATVLNHYVAELDEEMKNRGTWPHEAHWMPTLHKLYAMTIEALQPHIVVLH